MVENKEPIEINDKFREVIDLVENTDKSGLVIGKAGVGKSTLLGQIKDHTKKRVVVLAPTGLAALNIEGQTLHSFFRFPPQILDPHDIKKVYNGIYKMVDIIIIDEISMVRADLLDAIDVFMRLNGREPKKPFGGARMLFFGDLYQLPPVVESQDGPVLNKVYPSPYFFDAKVMRSFPIEVINLTKVYRQKDPAFIEFLDKVRLGKIETEDLEIINKKVGEKKDDGAVVITPTNKVANSINNERLSKLPDKKYTYNAIVRDDFKINGVNLPVDLELNLKKEARVMFVKNDKNGQWVNGTLGKVIDLEDDNVKVELDDGTIVETGAVDWDKIKHEYDYESKRIIAKVTGKLTQIPLRLAWALTIHKCQGQTLDKAHIDVSPGVWEFGHAYVALSRCRTLEGLGLETKIWPNDIKVDYRVTEFLKSKSEENKDG
ncbi:MAG: DEAD/DEAH box helicase [Candidatus Nanoarchaeia archaeon]|nr:DEAD/DEAH box helicase [Candidatus Nanoarchaeia archaeon]